MRQGDRTGIVELLCQCREIVSLAGRRPVDAESGAMRQRSMEEHNGAAVAVKERMRISKISHDLAGIARHHFLVPPARQCEFNGPLHILRTGKQNRTFADCEVWSGLQAVLSCPWVDGVEQNSVGLEQV